MQKQFRKGTMPSFAKNWRAPPERTPPAPWPPVFPSASRRKQPCEDIKAEKSRVTPYRRVVRDDGRLLEKLPGGPSEQARHLEAEGREIRNSAKLRVIL